MIELVKKIYELLTSSSGDKSYSLYTKEEITYNNCTFVDIANYGSFKNQNPEVIKYARNYFNENHSNLRNDDKIFFDIGEEKEGERKKVDFDLINQVDILYKEEDKIKKIKQTGITSERLNPLLTAIYLDERLSTPDEYNYAKSLMDFSEKRILNLYSSGWIDYLLVYCEKDYSLQVFPMLLEDMINDESLIFVHRFHTSTELGRVIIMTLNRKKFCILHAIGDDLNKHVSKILKSIQQTLIHSSYNIKYQTIKQQHKKGKKYYVEMVVNKNITPNNK